MKWSIASLNFVLVGQFPSLHLMLILIVLSTWYDTAHKLTNQERLELQNVNFPTSRKAVSLHLQFFTKSNHDQRLLCGRNAQLNSDCLRYEFYPGDSLESPKVHLNQLQPLRCKTLLAHFSINVLLQCLLKFVSKQDTRQLSSDELRTSL